MDGQDDHAVDESNHIREESGEIHQSDSQDGENEEQQQTFDRAYVEKLRKESAKYRDKAKRTEELEQRLHRSLVAQDGRLADPDDLEFNPEHLDDADALSEAITRLVASKPGLKAQQLSGDVGAGHREQPKAPTTDLLSIMKGLI
ncbi:hypothetical protein BA700_01885 [Corynebacterium stationis]|nr:hypothetical protein CA21670_01020 [Corynebacterium stationis]ASJ19860.1 hypothetical protein BA700_01885 [Corynebacterium stationis]